MSKSYMSRPIKYLKTMKNLLKFALVICLIFVFSDNQAQIKFGPKVGVNLSTMTFSTSGINMDPKTLVGFNVGVILESAITENISFQSGVIYSSKGSKYKITGSGTSVEMTVAPTFIEVPYNILYGFGTSPTKFVLFGGPYLGYGIGGNAEVSGETQKIVFGKDGDFKSLDFGLNLGAGVKYNGLFISAQYGLGLLNLSTTEGVENKMKVIAFSVSYLFGGK